MRRGFAPPTTPIFGRREHRPPIIPAGVVPPAEFLRVDPADPWIPTSDVPLVCATQSITTQSDGSVLVWWQADPDQAVGADSNDRYWILLYRDGDLIATGSQFANDVNYRPSGCMCWVDQPGAGAHEYEIQMYADRWPAIYFRFGGLTLIGLEHGALAMPVTTATVAAASAAVSIADDWTTLATVAPRLELDCPVMFATQGPLLNTGSTSVDVRIQRDGSTIWAETLDDQGFAYAAERSLSALWVSGAETRGSHTYTLQAKSSSAGTPWSWPTGRDRMFAAIELRAGRTALAVSVTDVAPGTADVADVYAAPYADIVHAQHTGTPSVAFGVASLVTFKSHVSAISTLFGRVINSGGPSFDQITNQGTAASKKEIGAFALPQFGKVDPYWQASARQYSSGVPSYATGQRQAAIIVFDAPGAVPTVATNVADWTLTNVTIATQSDGRSYRIVCTASTGEHKAVSPSPVNASTTSPTTIAVDVQSWAGVVDGCRIMVAGAYVDVTLATGAVLGSSAASSIDVTDNGAGGWIVSFVATIATDPVVAVAALDGGATSFAATAADYVQVKMLLPHGITQ